MSDFLRGLLGLVFTAAAVVFALANRQAVSVTLDPFHGPYDLPVFAVALGALAAGFVLGGFLVWFNAADQRAERRRQKKEIARLAREHGVTGDED